MIEIIPSKKEEPKKSLSKRTFPFMVLVLLGIFIIFGVAQLIKTGDKETHNSYIQELIYKGDNPSPVSATEGNINITITPEVAVIYQTSNGLSYANHNLRICNTNPITPASLERNLGLRFNQQVQDLKITEIKYEETIINSIPIYTNNIVGIYPNGSNLINTIITYQNNYGYQNVNYPLIYTTTQQNNQYIYYVPISLGGGLCKDYVLEYQPSEADNSLKWDAYIWQGSLNNPTNSLLLDPNWVLGSGGNFQIETYQGDAGYDGQNLSLTGTTNGTGYAYSVNYCPDGTAKNWSLVDWNTPFNYGTSETDTTDMRYYLQMNNTYGQGQLLENITNIGWTNTSGTYYLLNSDKDGCVIGDCINFTDGTGKWTRTIADDNNIENTNLSIEVWVKSSTKSITSYSSIYTYANTFPSSKGIMFGLADTGQLDIRRKDEAQTELYSNYDLQDNKWHLIYIQIGTDNNAKIYIDGKLITSGNLGGVIPSSTYTQHYIGEGWTSNLGWVGSIDELIVRTSHLTQSQIQEHYQRGIAKYSISARYSSSNATNVNEWFGIRNGQRELNSSVACLQYRVYSQKLNLTVKDPYLISINFTYNALPSASTQAGKIYFNDVSLSTSTGNNYTDEDLILSFTPVSVNLTNFWANITFTKENLLTNGLVAWWKLDENSLNQSDSSGNGNDGTVLGATFSSGKLGGAYEFGTSKYIWINNSNIEGIFQGNTTQTISLWARLNQQTGLGRIFSRPITTDNDRIYITKSSSISPNNNLGITIGSTTFSINNLFDNVSFSWVNIVLVNNKSNLTAIVYINGVFNKTNPTSANQSSYLNTTKLYLGTMSGSSDFFNGTIDDVRIWNRTLTDGEINLLYNQSYLTYSIPVINNTLSTTILSHTNTTKGDNWTAQIVGYASENWNISISNDLIIRNSPPTTPTMNYPIDNLKTSNYSVQLNCSSSTDADADLIYYEFWIDKSNPPATISQNSTLTTKNYPLNSGDSFYYWRCRTNDNASVSSYTSTRTINVDWRDILLRENYFKSVAITGDNQYFESNITTNQHRFSNLTSVIFNYNNTNYSATRTKINNTYYKVYTSISTPSISSATTKTFYWLYYYDLINGTSLMNISSSNTQSLQLLQLFNCSGSNASSVMIFNYTFKDEQNETNITATLKSTHIFWTDNKNINITLNMEQVDKQKVGICLTPPNISIYTEGEIEYDTALYSVNYNPRRYYYQNYYTTNTTHSTELYLLNYVYAQDVTFTVYDQDENELIGALIYLDKKYVSTSEYKTVEMGKTDDLGQVKMSLNYYDKTLYRTRVEKNGVLLYTSGDFSVIYGESTRSIRFVEEATTSVISACFNDIVSSLTYSNLTKTITATFTGTQSNDYILSVYERRPENDTWLCNNLYTGTNGELSCYYGNRTGGTFMATLKVKCYNEGQSYSYILDQLEINLRNTYLKQTLGKDGLWISALMILTLFLIGLWKPEVSVVFGLFGIIITTLLGFLSISWGVLVGIILVGILLIVKGAK